MCLVSLVTQDLVPQHPLAAQGEPRVQTFDRLFHFQAGMQAQVLGEGLRGMHGLFLRITVGGGYEQAISVYTRRVEP